MIYELDGKKPKIWGLTAMITAIFVNDYFDAGIKLDWKR